MRYIELAAELEKVLEARRRISADKYGWISKEGGQDEHVRLSARIQEIRNEMKEARYGKDWNRG